MQLDYPHLPELLRHLRWAAIDYERRRNFADASIRAEQARRNTRPNVVAELEKTLAKFDGELASVTDVIKELQP